MQCICEMAALFPTAGTFPHFATRFISPSVGFALAINYWFCYAISVASELSAVVILASFWSDFSPAAIITISYVVLVALNFCSVRWYAESEFWSALVKILLFVGLIIL